MANTLL